MPFTQKDQTLELLSQPDWMPLCQWCEHFMSDKYKMAMFSSGVLEECKECDERKKAKELVLVTFPELEE